ERMDETEAEDALASGRCAAVILLPEGFIHDISVGNEAKGIIRLSSAAASQPQIVEAVAKFGERILAAGQYGVFAGEHLIVRHRLGSDFRRAFLNETNLTLIDEAMDSGSRYFTFEVMEYLDTGMTPTAYFAMCWLLMLLFLISIFFIPLVTKDCDRGLLSRLTAGGITPARFVSSKLAILTVLRLILLTPTLILFAGLAGISINPWAILMTPLCAFFVSLIGICLTLCTGDGITGNAIPAVLGLFLCGGLVPRQLLPGAVTFMGRFTPFGAAMALISPIFGAPPDIPGILCAMLYAALAAIFIRRRLIRILAGRDVSC
ncbi:MAG: ABC transporter permease, partial [Ruminococcaceae bacterium]|nr:ABC transporter permease [Oscillospiraceae bacterium]